jgi:CRP-like cAMP-binding protein
VLETHVRIGREVFLGAFFGGSMTMDPLAMRRLPIMLRDEEFREGDVLYRQGEPSDRVYFFDKGRIRLVRDDAPAWTFVGRWIVGMADILAERPRSRPQRH